MLAQTQSLDLLRATERHTAAQRHHAALLASARAATPGTPLCREVQRQLAAVTVELHQAKADLNAAKTSPCAGEAPTVSLAHMLAALAQLANQQDFPEALTAAAPNLWLQLAPTGLYAAFASAPLRAIHLDPDTVQGVGAIHRAYGLLPAPTAPAPAAILETSTDYATCTEAMQAAQAALAIISQALVNGQAVAPHILMAAGHHMRESLQQICSMAAARERLEVKDYLEQGLAYSQLPPIVSGQQYILDLAQSGGSL